MDSTERVLRSVDFEGPDRVPNGCYNFPAAPGSRRAEALKRLFQRYAPDFGAMYGMARSLEWGPSWQRGFYRDEWGVVHKNLQDGVAGQPVEHPLAHWRNFDTYQFPDPLRDFDKVEEAFRHIHHHDKYLLASGGSIWHQLIALCGFNNVIMDFQREQEKLLTLIDKLVNYNLQLVRRWLEFPIDGVMFGDDWGTQQGLFINPQFWRRCFKCAYKRMFDEAREAGKHIFFHSDGYVMDIIPDLIEVGVNAVNIQVSLMGIENINRKFGGKVCIAADVDRQHTLPFGTTSEVRNLVKDIIMGFKGFNGGLILYGEIGPDVSLANAEAMLRSLEDYGRYQ